MQRFFKRRNKLLFEFMKVTYNKEADAAYIFLRDLKTGLVERTEKISEDIFLDFGKDDIILGIEILSASKRIGKNELKCAQHAHA
jgi:uncharacterized protein YuzE